MNPETLLPTSTVPLGTAGGLNDPPPPSHEVVGGEALKRLVLKLAEQAEVGAVREEAFGVSFSTVAGSRQVQVVQRDRGGSLLRISVASARQLSGILEAGRRVLESAAGSTETEPAEAPPTTGDLFVELIRRQGAAGGVCILFIPADADHPKHRVQLASVGDSDELCETMNRLAEEIQGRVVTALKATVEG